MFDVYEEDAASAKDEIVEWIKSTSAKWKGKRGKVNVCFKEII